MFDARKIVDDDDDGCYYPSEQVMYGGGPCEDGSKKGPGEGSLMSRGCQGYETRKPGPCCQNPCGEPKRGGGGGVIVALANQLVTEESDDEDDEQINDGPIAVKPTIPVAQVQARVPSGQNVGATLYNASYPRGVPPDGTPPNPVPQTGKNVVRLIVEHEFTYADLIKGVNNVWSISDANIMKIFGSQSSMVEKIEYCGHTYDGPLPIAADIYPESLRLNNIVDKFAVASAVLVEPGANIVLTPDKYVVLLEQIVKPVTPGATKFFGHTRETLLGAPGIEHSDLTHHWTIPKKKLLADGVTYEGPEVGSLVEANAGVLGVNPNTPGFLMVSDAAMEKLMSMVSDQVLTPAAQAMLTFRDLKVLVRTRRSPHSKSPNEDLQQYYRRKLGNDGLKDLQCRFTMGLRLTLQPVGV